MGNRNSNLNNANQQLLGNQAPNRESQVNLFVEDNEIKKTFAIKNPIFLKRTTLTLERDAFKGNIYYLSFSYDALVDFDMNIYYNCKKTFDNNITNFSSQNSIVNGYDFKVYTPSEPFSNKIVKKLNIKNGQDMKFFDKNVYLDYELFNFIKVNDENNTDIVIEMIPSLENTGNNSNNKVAFYTLCKFIEENSSIKLKVESQKLFSNNILIDVSDVYNSARESGECLLCFSNPRNTIYLPCKHSCCCKNCSHNLRMRNFPCPMYINDILILEYEDLEVA